MKAKIAGLILVMGMSVTVKADTFHFTPIIDPNNSSQLNAAVNLGDQLTMNVTSGGNNTALFTFSNDGNGGTIDSVISKIFFDDRPSSLFSSINIANDSGSNVNFTGTASSPLPGGNIPTFSFGTTQELDATHPHAFMGVNNTTASPGEFITLSAALNAGRSFADVINSLNAGDETNTNFLRVGLRVTSIDALDDGTMSYLDKSSGGASPPPPVPEPETYGMLLAGLGLMTAMARRRQKQ